MTKKNRLNPNAARRPALRNLQEQGVLRRMQVGVRNIVRASTNTVEETGLDLEELNGRYYAGLKNFEQCGDCAIGWVSYNGNRADLRGTQSIGYRRTTAPEFSSRFPVNRLATDLFNQQCTKGACYDPDLPVRGDAVLITDIRAHWYFRPNEGSASAEEIEAFNSMLTSSRVLIPSRYGFNPWIFFHVEPNEQDILAFMMRWV